MAIWFLHSMPIQAQDLLNDDIQLSGIPLELVEFTRVPNNSRGILQATSGPIGDDRLFITTSQGTIYTATSNADGEIDLDIWFRASLAVNRSVGRGLNQQNRAHGGLRSVAFHPEFEQNGKFYTSLVEDRPDSLVNHHYLGDSVSQTPADSVLVEWTYDHGSNAILEDSYRELFRINMPVYDHPIKQIAFNPFATPDDEDYGLLYINHGDASDQPARMGGGLNPTDALGKVLRIDPLAAGDLPYTTPGNPFVNDELILDEIYASGFRNPHNLSFAQDQLGQSHLIVADIGRENIEEINIVSSGANYGWSEREGTFVHRQNSAGYISGVASLPDDEAALGFTYPAAQFDHDRLSNVAVAGGHVIANGSDPRLQGQYIFGEFANSGKLYHASFDEMLQAVTRLDPIDSTRNEPGELSQATISQLQLLLDHDQDPTTPARPYDRFTSLLGTSRSDLRFGEGPLGELYLTSKQNGVVYLVKNSLPISLPGDLDSNGLTDLADVLLMSAAIRNQSYSFPFDITLDGKVDVDDGDAMVADIIRSGPGDTNLDRVVDFGDLVVLARNFNKPGDWPDGDFTFDGLVDFDDFAKLGQNFNRRFESSLTSVPEPMGSIAWLVPFGIWYLSRRARNSKHRANLAAI